MGKTRLTLQFYTGQDKDSSLLAHSLDSAPPLPYLPLMAAAAAARSPAALGLNCPVCLTLFEEPVTLQCGHSLCLECKDGLEEEKEDEFDSEETYFAVTCPSCRRESKCDDLSVSVQLRASIGALFPELVQARATVKRLTEAWDTARASEYSRRKAHEPTVEEKLSAIKEAKAAELRKSRAIAAEAREANRLANAEAKVAEVKKELTSAEVALAALEKAMEKGKGGGAGTKKRKQ